MKWGLTNRLEYEENVSQWKSFFAVIPHRCRFCWGWFWWEEGKRKYWAFLESSGYDYAHPECQP